VQRLDRLWREVVQCIDSGLRDEERGSSCDFGVAVAFDNLRKEAAAALLLRCVTAGAAD
jgi:hypothetical protein